MSRPDVAVQHQERAIAEQRQRAEDAAARLERLGAFVAVVQPHAMAAAVAERRADLVAEPRNVDHDVARSRRRQRAQVMHDQRRAARLEQRLRACERERAHALAAARREDHRPHARDASRLACTAGSTRSATSSPSAARSGVPRAGLDDVAERARHVRQVARLAVAVPQPREDAAGLEVALDAHQVEPAQELRRRPRPPSSPAAERLRAGSRAPSARPAPAARPRSSRAAARRGRR